MNDEQLKALKSNLGLETMRTYKIAQPCTYL